MIVTCDPMIAHRFSLILRRILHEIFEKFEIQEQYERRDNIVAALAEDALTRLYLRDNIVGVSVEDAITRL
jgi:hypothetical protein